VEKSKVKTKERLAEEWTIIFGKLNHNRVRTRFPLRSAPVRFTHASLGIARHRSASLGIARHRSEARPCNFLPSFRRSLIVAWSTYMRHSWRFPGRHLSISAMSMWNDAKRWEGIIFPARLHARDHAPKGVVVVARITFHARQVQSKVVCGHAISFSLHRPYHPHHPSLDMYLVHPERSPPSIVCDADVVSDDHHAAPFYRSAAARHSLPPYLLDVYTLSCTLPLPLPLPPLSLFLSLSLSLSLSLFASSSILLLSITRDVATRNEEARVPRATLALLYTGAYSNRKIRFAFSIVRSICIPSYISLTFRFPLNSSKMSQLCSRSSLFFPSLPSLLPPFFPFFPFFSRNRKRAIQSLAQFPPSFSNETRVSSISLCVILLWTRFSSSVRLRLSQRLTMPMNNSHLINQKKKP